MAVVTKKKTFPFPIVTIEDKNGKTIKGSGKITLVRKYGKVDSKEEEEREECLATVGLCEDTCYLYGIMKFENGSVFLCESENFARRIERNNYDGGKIYLDFRGWDDDSEIIKSVKFTIEESLLKSMAEFALERLTNDFTWQVIYNMSLCRACERSRRVLKEEDLFSKYPDKYKTEFDRHSVRVDLYTQIGLKLWTTFENIAKLDREIPNWRDIAEEYTDLYR